MTFEVWTSEKASRALALPVKEDNKEMLDLHSYVYPFVPDWQLDHTFEADNDGAADLYMVNWVEAQAPKRELWLSLLL